MFEIPGAVDESVQTMHCGKGLVRVITRVETYPNRKIKLSKLRKAVEITKNEDGTFDIEIETDCSANWASNDVHADAKEETIEAVVQDVCDQLRDMDFEIED